MITSQTIDASLLGSDRPQRDKLSIFLSKDEQGKLDVLLIVPLSPEIEPEKKAIDEFAPNRTLHVHYTVAMDLDAERSQLSESFAKMYRNHPVKHRLLSKTLEPLPDDELRSAFTPIAAQGRSIYRRLFNPTSYADYDENDAPLIRAVVLSALKRDQIIVIKSPVSLFPWAFLYADEALNMDDQTTFDPARFWGFRHILQTEIEGVSRRVLLDSPPRVIAAICEEVDTTQEHRSGPLSDLESAGRVSMEWVHSTAGLNSALKDFQGDCLYFYGHVEHRERPTPTTSCVKLGGQKLTVEQIDNAEGPKFAKDLVIAFLNGCESAPPTVWNEATVAGFLCLRGKHRVCCITTFAEVPGSFSAALAQRFWEGFLTGRSLGEALLDARTALFNEYRSPLGLLYMIFGRAETRLRGGEDGGA